MSSHHPTRYRHRPASRALLVTPLTGSWRDTIDFYVFLFFFAVCALGGGTAFANVPSLLYVRPLAVLCLTAFLLTPRQMDWTAIRMPALLLAALILLMIVQLVPLPPGLWTALPGRSAYSRLAEIMRVDQPWRPLSLTPDLTMNALVSLIVPAAVIAGFAKLRQDQRQASVILLIVLCCASAAIGIIQFAGGKDSPLYLYQRTYPGFPVGLLSNRNHQAALLSLVFPALRVWTLMPTADRGWMRNRRWIALALGVMIMPVVLATGSRAGTALMVGGIAAAFLFFPDTRGEATALTGARRYLARAALPLLAALLIVLTFLFGRAASIERLVAVSAIDNDQRFQFAPTILRIIRETFPAGTGFGSFDPVFRQYEPDAILISSFFNHAHNELLELIIMAGLPGMLVLAAFLWWWGARVMAAWRTATPATRTIRLGVVVTGTILLASLVDYTIRPPLIAAVFALGCCWAAQRAYQRD